MSGEGEYIYADARFTKDKVTVNSAPSPPSRPQTLARNGQSEKTRSGKNVWRIIVIIVGLATFVLLATNTGLVVDWRNSLETGFVEETCSADMAKSCKELKSKGTSSSGIHFVCPDKNFPPIPIYCDMETDGGGWTLVAGIHESDIRRKCFSDDIWSSYVPREQMSLTGQTSWENEMTFGSVHKCVEDDYKNIAYHALSASDVMVWHVQLGFHINLIRSRSTFRYRTTNGFLQKYGGNLKMLFTKHFPLKIKSERSVSEILDVLSVKGSVITSQIPKWYSYPVASGTFILDSTMYTSYGNQVTFLSSRNTYSTLTYGTEYRFDVSYDRVKTSVSRSPFILASTIWNEDQTSSYYTIETLSTRSSSEDVISHFENSVTLGNYNLQYQAVQDFNPSYNTPCEMYFVVSNLRDWNSIKPSSFERSTSYHSTFRQIRYKISGSPSKLVFGYILLASQKGYNVTSKELDKVANVILQAISTVPDPFGGSRTNQTLVAPIVFDKGTTEEIMNMVPPNHRPHVQPGYLQFRAYNYTGYPNAMCPGVRMGTASPEYLCIGGVSGDIEQYGTCGDFAGWAGKSIDKVHASEPSGSAHSHKDIQTTVLIFYR